VTDFRPNRNQARVLQRNADLAREFACRPLRTSITGCFQRYLESRHRDGGMAGAERDEYLEFLASDWAETSFVEFRQGDELVAVAIVDKLDDGLSAVYTFFDPDEARRSAGTYAVLWQIAEARTSWVGLALPRFLGRRLSQDELQRAVPAAGSPDRWKLALVRKRREDSG